MGFRRKSKDLFESVSQIVNILMSTYCAPLLADLFLFCLRETPCCLSDNNQADAIEAFNSTSRCLDDLLNIGNPYCYSGNLYISSRT